MAIKGMAFLCIGMISAQLNATVIYDDGGTHTINSFINDNIVLENFSDLNIEHGGFVITPGSDYAVHATPYGTSVNGSSVNMSGNATVVGGIRMNYTDGLPSSVVTRDNSTVQGLGVHPNGVGRAAISGAHNVVINDNSHIVGATSNETGGAAIENGDSGHYHVTVNGGEIVGGHGGETGGYGINSYVDPIMLNMTGGVIRGGDGDLDGGIGVVNMTDGSVVMADGAIYGGDGGVSGGDAFNSFSRLEMDIYGGRMQGGNGGAYGGSAMSTSAASGISEIANIQIFGGQFDAGLGSIVDGWIFDVIGSGSNMSIYGGQIGYSAVGAGINIDRGLVDVYGWDLRLDGDLLTGYLMDGNWIETTVTLAGITLPDRGLRLFNIANNNVPEPSVLLLMLSGLAGAGFRRLKTG